MKNTKDRKGLVKTMSKEKQNFDSEVVQLRLNEANNNKRNASAVKTTTKQAPNPEVQMNT